MSTIGYSATPRNRRERRARAAIERKLAALPPAARDLAMRTGLEMQEALEDMNKARFADQYDQIAADVEQDIHDDYHTLVREKVEQILGKTDMGQRLLDAEGDVTDLTRLYLETWLAWFADGGSPPSNNGVTAVQCLLLAMQEFRDQLTVLQTRVKKRDIECFEHPEKLFGALRWLATTYRDAKIGTKPCPDLDASCRTTCGFRYAGHQSEVTMGQSSDYEVRRNGKTVQLREHLTLGASHDPRHTCRVAFFTEDDKVVVGFIGQHQTTRQSN